jgi:hypothetical protein
VSHVRSITLIALLAMLVLPATLVAQSPSETTPRLEAGLDLSGAGPDGGFDEQARAILAPRLTINVTQRTALVLSGDLFTTRRTIGDSWAESRVVIAEVRRALVRTGRFSMSGLVGGGIGWTRTFQPEYSYLLWNERVTVPASMRTSAAPEVTMGLGFDQRIGSRLALHQEVRAVLGEVSELRGTLGVSVPFGRYPERFAPLQARRGGTPDSLRNGTTIGAVIGAAALGSFVAFLGNLLCEGECDSSGPIAVGAVYGAGAGALTGALIDSIRD